MTIEVFKTWSLKINPSVWFLRVVPLTNLRSNIHFELFLFTLIPAYLAFGISGPVMKRIERLLSFGPQSPENIGIKSTLAKLRRQNSTPGPPTSDVGYNNTAAVRNSPGYWGGGRVFSYGGSVCMCVPKGMMFAPFWSEICYRFLWQVCYPLRSEIRYGFQGMNKSHFQDLLGQSYWASNRPTDTFVA